jgi:hypothetical protein
MSPDRNIEMMKKDFGTVCLITDYKSIEMIRLKERKERNKERMEAGDAWTI